MTSQAATATSTLSIAWGTTVLSVRPARTGEVVSTAKPVTTSGYYKLRDALADGSDYVLCVWNNGRLKCEQVARIVGELTDAQLSAVLRSDERSGEDQRLLLTFVG